MHIEAMVWGAAQRGIDDLVERLERNDPTCTTLCLLRGRRFTDEDASRFAAAMEANTTLQELIVSSHPVSSAAAAAFARALAANTTLRSLDLGNRSFGEEVGMQLEVSAWPLLHLLLEMHRQPVVSP